MDNLSVYGQEILLPFKNMMKVKCDRLIYLIALYSQNKGTIKSKVNRNKKGSKETRLTSKAWI